MTLEGTVALVTGASSGIGEATARALAAQGAKVAIAARRKDRLDALAAEIGGLAIEADITDREQAIAAVERTVSELGRLDIVVNNAGVMLLGDIVDAPVQEWERMIDLNLKGLLYVAHAALGHLLKFAQEGPREVADLVNISSVAGRRVGQGGGIYQLTKHGVGVFSEALRQEVTARHVRSSLVEPGATESELVTHVREEVRSNLNPNTYKILEAADIADAVLYIVTRPRHMAVNEILIRPTEQVR
jgi:NADP-dependent 3-hydroxy acid dehydrogenase YdfG